MPEIRNQNPESQHQRTYAIIVAGGSGSRMQAIVPKQFLLINGMPILMHTINAFYHTDSRPEIIVVMHPNYHNYWKELCTEHSFTIPLHLVDGGETRFYSVKNGLALVPDDSVVAIQDAVRPMVTAEIIDNAYQKATEAGSAIVAVKSRDSVRSVRNGRSESLLRDEIYLVQTPQTFQSHLLKKAYLQPFTDAFTDDASVAERDGVLIELVEGSYQNIKITFPEDIAIAEMLLGKREG